MKTIWTAKDVQDHVGIVVANATDSEHWVLGYDACARSPEKYRLVSLRDGMVNTAYDAETMAQILTEENRGPLLKRVMTENLVKQGMRA